MLPFTYVVVGAIWTMNIGLRSSGVELLTRVAGVSGSIPSPAIYIFSLYLYAYYSFPTTHTRYSLIINVGSFITVNTVLPNK